MPKPKEGLYALYLRKSRADIEKEKLGKYETLAIHERELTELAKRDGYALDKPYYKELVSGEHISDRFEFQRLLEEVKLGKYRGILVHAVARLGRGDPMEYGYVLWILKSTGTLVITPTKVYDPRNEDDLRFLQFEMFMSNMELGNIRSRLVSGSRARAKMGSFVKSRAAYGYDRVRVDGMWTLKANDNAPTVRLIFERAAAGDPLGTIAREMNDAGMRTPCGGYWSAGRLGSIISNPHYMGKIRYNYYQKEQVPTDGLNYIIKNTYNENYILVDGLHDGIVDEDLWHAANNRNNGCAPVKRSHELRNPLAGLLVCKKCGRAMVRFINYVRSSGNKIPHYRHAAFAGCKCQGARVDIVVGVLCDALAEIAADLEVCEILDDTDARADELAVIDKQLAEEENILEKLFTLYYAEAITTDEFIERRKAAENLQGALLSRKATLEEGERTPQETAFTIREAIAMLKDDTVPITDKNAALRSFVDKIEYENHTRPRSRNYDIHLDITLKG